MTGHQACGRPVIAFAKGGSLETVIDGKTGVFFREQKTESVMQAIEEFETLEKQKCFNPTEISSHAKSFSTERFCAQIKDEIEQTLKKF